MLLLLVSLFTMCYEIFVTLGRCVSVLFLVNVV